MTMAIKSEAKESKSEGNLLQILREDGTLIDKKLEPQIPADDLKKLYELMVLTRAVDDRFVRMQRQGRVGFYIGSHGEEAAHIGSTYALEPTDWIFPQYREPGAALYRGFSLKELACQVLGNSGDLTKGRQMPSHYAFRDGRYLSISSPIATQIPHAVGFAWAGKIRKEKFVTIVYFGDGATSHGDFHVGMNFAGVFKTPTIFFNKNNQWAISVPFRKQTASAGVAVKGVAYGIESLRVDGNDLLAVIHATREAAKRARNGEGPTLIEALTYRMGAHSTSDDPRIYSDVEELEGWKKKDCILRFQKYLQAKGLWNEKYEADVIERSTNAIAKAIEEAEKLPPPPIESMFDDVYAELLPDQKEQLEYMLQFKHESREE